MPRPAGEYHVPALAKTVVEILRPGEPGIYCDLTVGGAGHGRMICDRLDERSVFVGTDRDPAAIEEASRKLKGVRCRVILRRAHMEDVGPILDEVGGPLRAALIDCGISSDQLDRGTGFALDDVGALLDMRQDPGQELTAAHLANGLSEKDLADLIYRYSDERMSRRIAAAIVRARPLETMGDLVGAVRRSLPGGYRHGQDTMRRVAMALRLATGRELEQLETALGETIQRLEPGGRIVVLCWMSLEQAVVKRVFRREKLSRKLEILTPKPLRPSAEEVLQNPRARAAHLRAAEKLAAAEMDFGCGAHGTEPERCQGWHF